MHNPSRKLALADVSRRLRVPYMRVYSAVADGTIPAERGPNNSRWLVEESDLPGIAERLGVPLGESL